MLSFVRLFVCLFVAVDAVVHAIDADGVDDVTVAGFNAVVDFVVSGVDADRVAVV